MKKTLLHSVCAMALLFGVTSCEGFDIHWGTGGGDDKTEETAIELTRCWHLKSFCNAPADVDIYIDFTKDGKFTIYQRTEKLEYTVFKGTYTADEENSVLTGEYNDGTSWGSSYHYTVDSKAKELVLESVEKPSEVAVYEPSEVPATADTRVASVNDVKPL